MVWNLSFQISGLVLILVIMYFSYSQRRLQFKAEKYFSAVLLNAFVCEVLDILVVIAMNFRYSIGSLACEIICEALLISIILVACHAAWFSVAEIRANYSGLVRASTAIPVLIIIIVCIFYDSVVYVSPEKDQIYFYGIPDTVTFVMCMIYVVSGLVMVLIKRKTVKRNRRITIYSWLIIWSFAGIFQRFLPQYSIVGFSIAIACLFMYCKLENPDQNMDLVNGIFNQKAFETKVEELLIEHSDSSIISFSLSNITTISEIFGRNSVNKLIKSISSFAQSFEDTLAFRFEDNVFCLIVDNRETPYRMEEVLEKVIDRFDQPWEIYDARINVNAGITLIDYINVFRDEKSVEEAIHYYLPEAAQNPGDVISIDSQSLEDKKKHMETQHALDWALSNNGVEVFYQPVYNIEKGYFTAMEALVRIRDEQGKLIFPNDFVEYAEKNGMILELGEQIFRKVCEYIRRSKIEQYGIEFIDVNLSVVQCMQEDLARVFKNIMGEYQIPPYRINLEITETAAVASKNTLTRNMEELIDYGISFSLDDYGSGYSNLSYIVGLPVSIIKIDRELTINYRTSEKVKIAIDSTIGMIHNLGMRIIVEGVETEEQYLDFKKLGANLIQGYYFSKPIPQNDVIPFLQKWL